MLRQRLDGVEMFDTVMADEQKKHWLVNVFAIC
jgi:hypothetical protein